MKRIKQWIAALCMTVSMTMTAFGGQWMQDNSGWWYQNDDGSYPVSTGTATDWLSAIILMPAVTA